MTLSPGATVGRYQILEPLGQGGMATVYRAFQPALERTVALKVIRPGFAEDPEFLSRFQREARAVAQLEHPNIVQVHDFDEVGGRYFMAMQHLEGGTLKARLGALAAEGKRIAPEQVARIVSEVAAGLGHAHAQGVLHRDVKPSNILFARDGRAVVSDFGIAKILGGTQLTQTGVGIGTPEYMSPEQGQGAQVDRRSDIYSLAVVAYELLTGRVPFSADTPFAVVAAHMRDPVPPPSRFAPQVGPATERVLLKALAKDPADRYASTTELAAALARAVVAGERVTGPTVVVRRRRIRAPLIVGTILERPFLAALVAVGLLGAGGGASVLLGGMLGGEPGALPTPSPFAPAAAVAETPAPTPTSIAPSGAGPTSTPMPTPLPTPTQTAQPTVPPTSAPVVVTPAPTPVAQCISGFDGRRLTTTWVNIRGSSYLAMWLEPSRKPDANEPFTVCAQWSEGAVTASPVPFKVTQVRVTDLEGRSVMAPRRGEFVSGRTTFRMPGFPAGTYLLNFTMNGESGEFGFSLDVG